MRNARRNEVRHMQFDFPVARGIALSRFAWWLSVRARGHILPLDDSHATHRFSRSIDNLAYARDRSRGDPKFAPTFFATDLCRRRVLRGTAAGGREVGLYAHFTSVFVSLFFPRAFQPPFLCLPSFRLWNAINRRDNHGTRTLRFFLHVMLCAMYIREACKKLLSTSRLGLLRRSLPRDVALLRRLAGD